MGEDRREQNQIQRSAAGQPRRMSLVESERQKDWGAEERGRRIRRARRDAGAAQQPETAGMNRSRQPRVKHTEDGNNTAPERQTSTAESVVNMKRPERKSGESLTDKGWQQKLQERKKLRIRRAMIACAGVFGAAYIAAAVYFGSHFYEDTVIYGIDCSQKTAEEVKRDVAERLGDYRLEIQERGDKAEYMTADQIGLEFVDNSSVDQMLRAQHSYIWPIMLLMSREDMVSVSFSYDQDAAFTVLDSLSCMQKDNMIAPRDACVKAMETEFIVEPEVMGTTLDEDRTREALVQALDGGKTVVSLEDEGCYVDPEVYADNEELIQEAEGKSAVAKANITFDFGDRTETVNAPVIEDWITTTTDGSYVIDDVKVTDYVESLAAKYDTFGLTREFYTSLGTTVTLTGGDYGWCMDQDATVIDLLNALQSGYQGTMEPEYVYTAKSRDTNDIGGTYVEICISQQRMWCYQDNVCVVDTPVVTGNPNRGNGTPSGGVWAIDSMNRNSVLVGEGYRAPVDYWMPFNGNIGIHDLKQRAYFGGSIYLSNGSHGCVNTPYEAVQTIYNTISVGTPVIVYD